CVVNGPGEALVSHVGLAGAKNKSGLYIGGARQKLRLDNQNLVDELEAQIREQVKFIEANKIDVKEING
ncbi:hypothetical protein R0J89_15360, partial [Psychrobacter sp. SIMBA_152]